MSAGLFSDLHHASSSLGGGAAAEASLPGVTMDMLPFDSGGRLFSQRGPTLEQLQLHRTCGVDPAVSPASYGRASDSLAPIGDELASRGLKTGAGLADAASMFAVSMDRPVTRAAAPAPAPVPVSVGRASGSRPRGRPRGKRSRAAAAGITVPKLPTGYPETLLDASKWDESGRRGRRIAPMTMRDKFSMLFCAYAGGVTNLYVVVWVGGWV
jgi:hypothetical protein